METKQYLRKIEKYDRQIRNKQAEINRIKMLAMGIGSGGDSERVQSSGDKDKVGMIISRTIDMEKELTVFFEKRQAIVKQIESIDDVETYDVLANIYILQKPLKVIAVEKRTSYRSIKDLHTEALEIFEEKYGHLYLEM